MKVKEEELAKKVVEWLQDNHWDVYQEVVCNERRADIVAKNGPLLWVIECKLSQSLDVIGQAYEWRDYSHLISIAVPKPKKNHGIFASRILRDYGIGRIYCGMSYDGFRITEDISSVLNRKPCVIQYLIGNLCDEQKTWAGAGTNGGYWTPFNSTRRNVERYVSEHPGCFYKDMIDNLDHHYHSRGSANSAIRHWIDRGVISVRTERGGRYLRLYPLTTSEG